MTSMDRDQAWQRLCEAGLAQGEIPAAEPAGTPWYVRVMLGIAGWIGAVFLIGFVGAAFAFVMRSAPASIAVGIGGCVAAYAILRAGARNEFLTQFGFAISLAGQFLFAFGLFVDHWSGEGLEPARLFIFALFEAGLAVALPLFIHRVWSAWAAVYVLGLALGRISLGAAVPGILAAAAAIAWLNEFAWARHHRLARPIGYGLALGLLQSEAFVAWGLGAELASIAGPKQHPYGWASAAMAGIVLLYVAWRLLAREADRPAARVTVAAFASAALIALLGIRMPGLAAAAMLTVLGFANGNRLLLGLGIFGLIAFVSSFYYRLDVTLLDKSAYLAAAGAVLLIAHQLFVRVFGPPRVRHA